MEGLLPRKQKGILTSKAGDDTMQENGCALDDTDKGLPMDPSFHPRLVKPSYFNDKKKIMVSKAISS